MRWDKLQKRLAYWKNLKNREREECEWNKFVLRFASRFCGLRPKQRMTYMVLYILPAANNGFFKIDERYIVKLMDDEGLQALKKEGCIILSVCPAGYVRKDEDIEEIYKCIRFNGMSRYNREFNQWYDYEQKIRKDRPMLVQMAIMLKKAVDGIEPPAEDYLDYLRFRARYRSLHKNSKPRHAIDKLEAWRKLYNQTKAKQDYKVKMWNIEAEKAFWASV